MINRATLNSTFTPAPPRVSLPLYLFGAAILLLVLQLLSGTGPVYALLVFALLVASYAAVSWAGGLQTLFGIAIFYLLLQHVLVSQIAKIFFWEPADATLRQPIVTMGVYAVGMASLALGVRLADHLRRRKGPLFVTETRPSRLFWISVLCTVFSTALNLATRTVGIDESTGNSLQGGLLGPLKQLTFLGPLAIASGTAYMIKTSGGRRSFGPLNAFPIVISTAAGIYSTTREIAATPIVIYVLTCVAFRYRFRPKHYSLLLVVAYIANFIIFPYALVARHIVHTGSVQENISRSASMMLDIVQNPFKYRDQVDHQDARRSMRLRQFDYYKHSSPTLDRYTVMAWADGVVDATINSGETGWQTITPGFIAALPRFLAPDKPFVNMGNFLSHREPGLMLNKKDRTTGITLGFFADAFSSFGWLGISLIPCLIMICFTPIYRLLISDNIRNNALILSLMVPIIWPFSEATIADMITMSVIGPLAAGISITILYVLAYAFDRVTNRVRNVWVASVHPRQRAMERVLAATPRRIKYLDAGRSGPL